MPVSKKFLFRSKVRMRTFNQLYVYFIHLLQAFLDLMPPFIRNLGFRLMLGRTGKHVFFDYGIYIKFPWLVEMGDDVSVNRGAQFFPAFKGSHKIVIGNDVYIGPNVCFFASGHDLNDLSQLAGNDIVVGDHVWIGANAIILPGVKVGSSSVIGAGSVVTKDIQENSIMAGNPARLIRGRTENSGDTSGKNG